MNIKKGRWLSAQEEELKYWSSIKNIEDDYIKACLPNEDLISHNKVILDVGGGPRGSLSYINNGTKICLDPLIFQQLNYHSRDKSIQYLYGMGEFLPLEDGKVDIAFCINALDHMLDPKMVLREISRVLRSGGVLILYLHTYSAFGKNVRNLKEKINIGRNVPHPHTFMEKNLIDFLRNDFYILECRTLRESPIYSYLKSRRIYNFVVSIFKFILGYDLLDRTCLIVKCRRK